MKLIHLTESVGIELGPNAEEVKYKALHLMESKGGIVVPVIEAIHASVTRNCTFYGAPKLKGNPQFVNKDTGKIRPSGVYSWTTPFNKPMLKNHDIETEPLGRITKAEFKNKTSTGVPGIIIYPEIVDPDAAQKVLDGRYKTVSIGADVSGAVCSICKCDVFSEECTHWRGKVYEGKLCYWIIGDHWYGECSFVNAPSDENAGVKDIPGISEAYVQMGLLVQDLREHKVYDLEKDEIYAATNKGLILIPRSEYMQEYYYIPFNIKMEENEEQGRINDLADTKKEETIDKQAVVVVEQEVEVVDPVVEGEKQEEETPVAEAGTKEGITSEVKDDSKDNTALIEHVKALAISLGIVTETSDKEKEDIQVLKDQIEGLQAENLALKNENDSLTVRFAELKQGTLQEMVEKILTKKLEFGDITEEQKASEKEKLITRSEQSLKDALDDLNQRKSIVSRSVEKVTSPALADNTQKGTVEVSTDGEQETKKETVELKPNDIYKGLLTGKKNIQDKGRIK